MRCSHSKQGGMIYIECGAGACKAVYALTELELSEVRRGRFKFFRLIYRRLRRNVAATLQGAQR